MKLSVVYISMLAGAVLGGVINQDQSNIFNEISELDSLDSINDELNSNVDYSKEKFDIKDEADDKAGAVLNILKPEILGPFLLHGKGFNYQEIGLSKKNYLLIKTILLPAFKNKVNKEVKNRLKKIRKGKNKAEIKKNYRDLIDILDATENQKIEDNIFQDIRSKIGENQDYLKLGPIIITYFNDLFEGEVLKVIDEFFLECNSYKPEVAKFLRETIDKVQSTFNIFPDSYYALLKENYH